MAGTVGSSRERQRRRLATYACCPIEPSTVLIEDILAGFGEIG